MPPDPFDEWFKTHVICNDVFKVLLNDSLKYDLIIVDPPFLIPLPIWRREGCRKDSETASQNSAEPPLILWTP